MGKIMGYFIAILVLRSSTVGMQLGLVGHIEQFLVMFFNTLEPFPSFLVKEVIFLCIEGTGNWVISSNHTKGFRSNVPILPFSHSIMTL